MTRTAVPSREASRSRVLLASQPKVDTMAPMVRQTSNARVVGALLLARAAAGMIVG